MPSSASSSSTTYCGMMQRLGPLAIVTLVVSGGASAASAPRRRLLQASPAAAVVVTPRRRSRLVGNIGASRFAESVATPPDIFNATLSDSRLQARHGNRGIELTFSGQKWNCDSKQRFRRVRRQMNCGVRTGRDLEFRLGPQLTCR